MGHQQLYQTPSEDCARTSACGIALNWENIITFAVLQKLAGKAKHHLGLDVGG